MSRESITAGSTAGGTRRAATHYGRRVEETQNVAEYNVDKNVFEQVVTFNYDTLPTYTLDELQQRIPVGARILGATIRVHTSFTATTAVSLNIGLMEPDGSTIDVDGIDAAVALTDLEAGEVVDCDGALVGAASVLTAAGQLTIVPNVDDLLTGQATITIRYEVLDTKAQTMNG